MPNRIIALFVLLLIPLAAFASEDPLAELWPAAEGLRFDYDYAYSSFMYGESAAGPAFLEFTAPTTVPDGAAWLLEGSTPAPIPRGDVPPPGLMRYLWTSRPDLRARLEGLAPTRDREWSPYFLHTGIFRDAGMRLEMWQPGWNHSTWTYMVAPPVVGMSFTHQLVPELADDIYLHGVITDTNAQADTPAGIFENCVVVTYLIDMGVSEITDESGEVVGTMHGEVAGHVAFAPMVGPVELLEQHTPFVWVDCGDAPCHEGIPAWSVGQVGAVHTLMLSQMPVGNENRTWSDVKAMFR